MTTQLTPPDSDLITVNRVKAALNAQLHGRDMRHRAPLETLALVEQVLADPMFPPCDYGRTIALGLVLNTLITKALARHRDAMLLPRRVPETSRHDALRSIAADVQTGNRELIGWSWLYYHYVRVDLYTERFPFLQVYAVDERTLRRYEMLALGRLTALLILREWDARLIGNPGGLRTDSVDKMVRKLAEY
jgi:hypothetical protein